MSHAERCALTPEPNEEASITYLANPNVNFDDLNGLYAASWEGHSHQDFTKILQRSLAYVCAYQGRDLIGFVNVAWDGGIHAFILDTTVHPDFRRRGIGVRLVREAATEARRRGAKWLHVDYEPHLRGFYRRCGFQHTEAGLMRLDSPPSEESLR